MNQLPTRRPNVIVFFTDQQRWDTTGVHGNPLELTPNFDRMAIEGTHVRYAFTCQPVCGPARASLQTGLYATQTGCFRNGIPLPPESATLAKYFNAAGYDTGYIGKWHLGSSDPVIESERAGYQYWLASNVLEFTSEPYHTVMYDNDGQPVTLPGYRIDALTDAAIRYVDTHQAQPFFLFISYMEPHFQNHVDDYPPPDGYRERYAGRWMPSDLAALGGTAHQHLGGYFGMVKRLDEALGRLRDALKSLDLTDNTIILFTSDHGCHFKTRNSEYKRSCHESSIRVPLAITGPGFDSGGQIRELVSLVDIPPTLLDAAHIPVPGQMQGRSILPLISHRADDWPEEVYVQISEAQVGRSIRTHRWKYTISAPTFDPVVDSVADRYNEESLYDLKYDPYEMVNLIHLESHRRVASVMEQRMLRRMQTNHEPLAIIEHASIMTSGQRRVDDCEINQ